MPMLRSFSLKDYCATSADYAVQVDGAPVWVEQHGEVSIARFAIDGRVQIEVTPRLRVDWWDLRPRSRDIRMEWAWNKLRFTLPGPDRLWLEMPGLQPLLIVASGPESMEVAPGATLVFGPGEHRLPEVRLQDRAIVWIDGDAILRTGVTGSPTGARLLGPGVIDAGLLERPRKVIELIDAHDVVIDGPMLRAGPCWQNAIIRCSNITVRRATIVSHGRNGDGIDIVASRRIRIEDCFFRCTDDCISLKCNVDPRFMPEGCNVDRGNLEDIEVRGCTFVGWLFADGFTIGFECRGETIRDVTVRDCDVLYARGHSSANGHSAFSVICDGPAAVSGIRFENICVEEDVLKNFELYVTHGGYYVHDGPGSIRDVVVRNVSWTIDRPIVLHGHDNDHSVEGVRFENCRVAGRPLTADSGADIRIGPAVGPIVFTHDPDAALG